MQNKRTQEEVSESTPMTSNRQKSRKKVSKSVHVERIHQTDVNLL